ncbi:MAG TPA: NAD(P)-dependent oxidoreductase, partial [Anaerolineae bacterium]|nr:NAD(P)-dependent oxidoreductase [Anaerolineae bacterium]
MRVLITGVTGFIGSHLAERLLAEGVAVRGLARRPADAAWLAKRGTEIVQADLAQRTGLDNAAQGCDALLHSAAWTGGPDLGEQQAWTVNVAATGWLLQAAQDAGVQRFVYFSSVAVYGLNPAPLIDETAPTPPVRQLYPDSKIAAETLVRAAQADGLQTTIIRPASTYGPRGAAWTVGPVEQIKAGRLVLLGQDLGLVNTGYIDNVVDGVLLALRNPAAAGETFNLCDGAAVTYREFYGRYAAMLG